MKGARKFLALALFATALCGYSKPEQQAGDLTGDKQQEFIDVAGELRCPTCTGLSVLESDAAFSVQIKDIVREKVKEGKGRDEILKYFTERYGPWILRSPPKEGFNLLAWGFPVAVLVFGPLLVWWFVWRRGRTVAVGYGVRPAEEILKEMHDRLDTLRRSS